MSCPCSDDSSPNFHCFSYEFFPYEFYFFLNDSAVPAATITGEQNWTRMEFAVGPGVHTLEWAYAKNGEPGLGSDAGWVDELAFVPSAGDAAYHIDARVRQASILRSTLVYTAADPALAEFRGRALLDFQQLDEAALPPTQTTLPVRVTWTAENAATGTPVSAGDYDTTVTVPSHTGGTNPLPGTALLAADFNFTAGANLSIDPLTSYRLRVTARYMDPGGNAIPLTGEALTGNTPLLTLSGRLTAGVVEARFHEIGWSPGLTTSVPPGHRLEVDSAADAVWLLSDPTVRFRLAFNTVHREPNSGDLELRAGIPINLTAYTKPAGGLPVTVSGATLTENGFTAGNVAVRLPAGMGVALGGRTRLMDSFLTFIGPAMNPATGLPMLAELTYAPGAPLHISHDQVPVRFHPDDNQLTWNVADGTFRCGGATVSHVASREDAWLRADAAAGALDDNAAAQKPSNDGPWRTVENIGLPSFFIRTDAQGRALLNATVPFAAGSALVEAHFPSRVQFTVTGGGVTVADGVFDPASSVTVGPSVSLTYERDAGGAGECGLSAAGSTALTFSIAENALYLTPDGGWRGAAVLDSAARVDWGGTHPGAGGGRATHQLSGLGPASFLLPGTWLSGPAAPGTSMDRRASALLLSGTGQGADAAYREFPDTTPYAAGLADYAGLNLHRPAGGLNGRSYLANSETGYALKPQSKFIVRRAGVSGVLDAVTASLSPALRLYNYASELDGLRLSFIDSKNAESATSGSISLPEPAGFEVDFERLTFTPGGHLDDAELPANPGTKPLVYWGCQLEPDMLDFTPERSGACSTGVSYLTLGGRISLGAISPTAVRGALAFKPDGNLITPSDRLAKGVDSSLPVPSGMTLRGRGDLIYPFTPATRLRFSNYRAAAINEHGDRDKGFLFAAGTMDVPFFEDLKVLLHLETLTGSYQVIGGWPSDPSQSDRGWTEPGNRNYFTGADFDPDNFGYPGAAISGLLPASSRPVSLGNFRQGLDAGQTYRPWVRKDWRKMISFEFPMKWDAVGRQFLNAKSEDLNLIVLRAAAQVRSLDAAGAEITFGTEFQGLPNFNAQGLSRALTDGASLALGSPEKRLADALSNALTDVVKAGVIGQGQKALDELLDDTLGRLLNNTLPRGVAAAAGGTFDAFYNAFRDDYMQLVTEGAGSLSAMAMDRAAHATTTALGGQLDQQLRQQVLGTVDDAATAMEAIDRRLGTALAAIDEILKVCNPDQPAPVTPPTVTPGLGSANPFLQAIARQVIIQQLKHDYLNHGDTQLRNQLNTLLSDLVKEARPVLRQITVALTAARKVIVDLQDSLRSGLGGTRNLKARLEAAFNTVAAVRQKTMETFLRELGAARDVSRNFFAENSVEVLRERFVQTAISQFHASGIEQEIRKALQQLVGPVNLAARQAIDLVFAQVNNMVNQVALKLVREFRNMITDQSVFSDMGEAVAADFERAKDALGTFGDDYLTTSANIAKTLQFAKAQGYARTKGDTLDEIRLDARIGLAVPDEIGFSGFVHIRNVEADVPSTSCRAPGAVATEITLGSTAGVSLKRGKNDNSQQGTTASGLKPFEARVEGRFSFPPGNGARFPNGLDGLIDFQSEMDMGAFTLKQVRLKFGLGGDEAYAIAAARGSVWFIEGEGLLFMGSTKQKAILEEALDVPTLLAVVQPLAVDPLSGGRCLEKPVIGVYGRFGGHLSINRLFAIPDTSLLSLSAGRLQSQYAFVTNGGNTLNIGFREAWTVQGKFLYVIGLSAEAGYLLQGNLDIAQVKADGLMGVINGLSGTAILSAEGCAKVLFAKVCGRVDMIFDVQRNPVFPPVLPPVIVKPVRIKF